MIFTVEQIRSMREGKMTAALVTRWECPSEKTIHGVPTIVRPVRSVTREFLERDGDGNPTGGRLRERMSLVVTVRSIQRNVWVLDLGKDVARECGWRTVAAMREDWRNRHPHSDLACLVRFELGDTIEQPHFLTWTKLMRWDERGGRAGTGDYTANAFAGDQLEALPAGELQSITMRGRQNDARHRADAARLLAARPAGERLAEIQRARAARRT